MIVNNINSSFIVPIEVYKFFDAVFINYWYTLYY